MTAAFLSPIRPLFAMNPPVHRRQAALLIACPGFAPAEVDALRSLLALIRPYLKRPWEIATAGPGDVTLVNLDAGAKPELGAAVGCAQKPRMHAPGTIHRPLRVAELLAVLTEAGERAHAAPGEELCEGTVEWSYALRAWPLDLEGWPRPWWRVMALLTHGRHRCAEVVARTGLAGDDVERCLAQLQQRGLLDRQAERCQVVPAPQPQRGWRNLAARVGQLLGFAA